MARDDPYFRLRIPENLKKGIQEASDNNKRSMTAEIIARLEESFDPKATVSQAEEVRVLTKNLNLTLSVMMSLLTQFERNKDIKDMNINEQKVIFEHIKIYEAIRRQVEPNFIIEEKDHEDNSKNLNLGSPHPSASEVNTGSPSTSEKKKTSAQRALSKRGDKSP